MSPIRLEDLPPLVSPERIHREQIIPGLGRNGIYGAIRRRELLSVRIGRKLFVPRVALERLVAGELASAQQENVALDQTATEVRSHGKPRVRSRR